MSHKKRKRQDTRFMSVAPGAPTGPLTVDPGAPKSVISAIAYGPHGFVEQSIESPDEAKALAGQWPHVWVNVSGLGDAERISRLGELFKLHRLALEDAVHVRQRAKVEEYPEHLFVVARMIEEHERLETEQLSMFVGASFVITFQESTGDCFDPIREHLRTGRGKARQAGPDYLAYCLFDAVVDHYYPVMERFAESLENLETLVLERPQGVHVKDLNSVKRDLLTMRRALWPLREAMHTLIRDPLPQVREETRLYLRDTYDHTVQIIDLLETYRETSSNLLDIYLSSLSNRMNEIMKVLTVMTTIFMPLSFVAGVYGMNFDREAGPLNMPELGWPLGYLAVLGLMALIAAAQFFFFWRRGWLNALTPSRKD